MQNSTIIQLSNQRFLDLTTYLVVVVMYLLGTRDLVSPLARVMPAILCVAIALLYATVFHASTFARFATWYFAAQTALVAGLMAFSLEGVEFYTMLFFLLSIHAGAVFPERSAAGWIVLFFGISSLANFALRGADVVIPISFNVTVFLLCGMFGNNLRQTELARRHNQQLLAELEAAHRQLRALAVTEERNRLAREIHDGLGHYLTATTMQIQGAKALLENSTAASETPGALAALGKAETLLQEALVDVRRSVAALRTTPGDGQPLPAAIQQLVAQAQATAGLEAQYAVVGAPRTLNSQAELTLYRAAQEGLTNVCKHAQATHVEISLRYEPGKVCLSIADNGVGQGAAGNGFGLLGLRERVQLQGGVVTIDSQPGQGFRLAVEIPA
jgi:signal transduction histidine kinase